MVDGWRRLPQVFVDLPTTRSWQEDVAATFFVPEWDEGFDDDDDELVL